MRFNYSLKLYDYLPGLSLLISVMIAILTGFQSLVYMTIFYWSVFRSDLLPISLLFSLGLIQDSFCSYLLGQETLLYLVFMMLIYIDRSLLLHRDFGYLWVHITVLMMIISLGKLFVFSRFGIPFVFSQHLLDIGIEIFLFPIYVYVMSPFHSKVS